VPIVRVCRAHRLGPIECAARALPFVFRFCGFGFLGGCAQLRPDGSPAGSNVFRVRFWGAPRGDLWRIRHRWVFLGPVSGVWIRFSVWRSKWERVEPRGKRMAAWAGFAWSLYQRLHLVKGCKSVLATSPPPLLVPGTTLNYALATCQREHGNGMA
jgi:hypothetical protein